MEHAVLYIDLLCELFQFQFMKKDDTSFEIDSKIGYMHSIFRI